MAKQRAHVHGCRREKWVRSGRWPAQVALQRDHHEHGSKVMTRMAHDTGAMEDESDPHGRSGRLQQPTCREKAVNYHPSASGMPRWRCGSDGTTRVVNLTLA